MKFVKDINKLKDIVNILDNENLLIETSMEPEKLQILNETIPNLKFNIDKHVNELDVMLNLSGNNKTKKDIESLIGKFMYLYTKHLWCLYLTEKITYDKLNIFYSNIYKIDINTVAYGKLSKEYLRSRDRDSRTRDRDSRDRDRDSRSRDRDRYSRTRDSRDRDSRTRDRGSSSYSGKPLGSGLSVDKKSLLDYDPDRSSLSLQRIITDMRIRKNKNMLYMSKDENHPIIIKKIDEWISLHCNDDAKTLAGLFKSNTKYISWKKFYSDSIKVFDKLYDLVKDKTYCVFTKGALGVLVLMKNQIIGC